MGRSFAITSLTNTVELKEDKTGEVTLTVTNKGGRPLRGMARIIPIEATRPEWVMIADGEPERAFDKDGTHQYKVRIILPADTPKGTYTFRMDFVSSEDPDGDSTQGPAIAVKLSGEPAPTPGKKFPWWILIVVGAAVLIGVVTTVIILTTGGPKMIDVPDLLGKTLEEANQLAEEAGLTTQLGEEQNKPGAAPGTVVDQKPPKGEKAEKGSAIEIFAQKAAPPAQEMVDVPDVRKRTLDQAKLALFEKGFTPKEGAAQFKGGPPGLVVDQVPAAATKAARGSVVTYIPEAESIVVPDVRSRTFKDAFNILRGVKFEVELQEREKPGAPAEIVFDQKPGPGERAQAKATVVIVIPKAPVGRPPVKPGLDHRLEYKAVEGLKVSPGLRTALFAMPANSITSVKPNLETPASLISGESVMVSFSYATAHPRVTINVQPMTKGVRTPGSTELNFQVTAAGNGEFRGNFTVSAKEATHINELWIRMIAPDKSEPVNQKFPVQLQFWPRK